MRKSVKSRKSLRKSVKSRKSLRKSVKSKKSLRKSVKARKSLRKSVKARKSLRKRLRKSLRKMNDGMDRPEPETKATLQSVIDLRGMGKETLKFLENSDIKSLGF